MNLPLRQDLLLTEEDVKSRSLPRGGCCCPETHGHVWYERREGGDVWHECYFCSEVLPV